MSWELQPGEVAGGDGAHLPKLLLPPPLLAQLFPLLVAAPLGTFPILCLLPPPTTLELVATAEVALVPQCLPLLCLRLVVDKDDKDEEQDTAMPEHEDFETGTDNVEAGSEAQELLRLELYPNPSEAGGTGDSEEDPGTTDGGERLDGFQDESCDPGCPLELQEAETEPQSELALCETTTLT